MVKIVNNYVNVSNFTLIKNKKNLGVAASANIGILKSKGKNIVSFEEELGDIGALNPTIIGFGNDSFNILKKNLGSKYNILKANLCLGKC